MLSAGCAPREHTCCAARCLRCAPLLAMRVTSRCPRLCLSAGATRSRNCWPAKPVQLPHSCQLAATGMDLLGLLMGTDLRQLDDASCPVCPAHGCMPGASHSAMYCLFVASSSKRADQGSSHQRSAHRRLCPLTGSQSARTVLEYRLTKDHLGIVMAYSRGYELSARTQCSSPAWRRRGTRDGTCLSPP